MSIPNEIATIQHGIVAISQAHKNPSAQCLLSARNHPRLFNCIGGNMPLTTASTTGADNQTSGYLNKSSLCVFLGGKEKPLGKSTINDWMKEKGFPKPIRLSQTLALWRVSEVVQWVEARASANDDYLEAAK